MTEFAERTTDVIDQLGRLREARLYLGCSVEQIARHLGESPETVALWEAGCGTVPETAINELSVVYQRPVGWLLGEPRQVVVLDPSVVTQLEGASDNDRGEVVKFAEWLRGRTGLKRWNKP